MRRTVHASAPARIDFAGGTLDIHPIYLFFNGCITLNAAIDLEAKVSLSTREDSRVHIRSVDTGASLECAGADSLPIDGPLALITRVLRYYGVPGGLDVTTHLLPPHGSGLGASSALFIALSHAVLAFMGRPRDSERIIRTSNNLEAQLMGMPAGTQDYYPPTYGSINALHYAVDGIQVESLDPDGSLLPRLQEHLIVSYTNITHHSGTTNWSYMRNFFDGVPETVASLRRIKETADAMYHAFHEQDIRGIAQLLDVEWENRKRLSDDATAPDIDCMMNAAKAAGAWASKLCGAGGGGCMLTMAPPESHERVIAALETQGASYLQAQLVREGVRVTVREEP